jgi:hypothetical protein
MSEYLNGFVDGLKEAARELNEAARDHYEQSVASKKILESQAHQLAASLLSSWANGMIIRADAALSTPNQAEAGKP